MHFHFFFGRQAEETMPPIDNTFQFGFRDAVPADIEESQIDADIAQFVRNALAILTVPIVEVHMSNNHARDKFRQYSVISEIAKGYIAGFGIDSYLLGLRAAVSASAAAQS